MSTLTGWPLYQSSPWPVRRFTVDEYHQMIQAGILTENDPVELLEGWITPKMPRDPLHDTTIDQADEALRTRLPTGWRVRCQLTITTTGSEPEPDLAVVIGPVTRYLTRHPSGPDIGWLVEVANSSLAHDRDVKGRIYAREAIPVYWIINLVDRIVEVYTNPTGPTASPWYQTRQDYTVPDLIPLSTDGDIPAAELLL